MKTDKALFWELIEPEYERAAMFCRKLTGSRDLGDDLLQDGLLAAHNKFHTLRDHLAFRAWLYRILVNRFTSQTRRPWWKRRVSLTPALADSLGTEDPQDVLTARRWLQKAFVVLSPAEQALVTLHELEGWSVTDLAELNGKTEGATKAALFRARRKMQRALLDLQIAGTEQVTGAVSET
ncbi:MAG: RNA polymerase sigma factor [bacterium]